MHNASDTEYSRTASTRLGPNAGQDRPEFDERGCASDAACCRYRIVDTPYTGEIRARGGDALALASIQPIPIAAVTMTDHDHAVRVQEWWRQVTYTEASWWRLRTAF